MGTKKATEGYTRYWNEGEAHICASKDIDKFIKFHSIQRKTKQNYAYDKAAYGNDFMFFHYAVMVVLKIYGLDVKEISQEALNVHL